MRIEVTAEDIAAGRPKDACCCPVARAISRAMGAAWEAYGVGAASHDDDGWIDLPAEAERWIAAFDAGRPVEPFAFEVEVEPRAAS
jgi:hypothetical protein